MSKREYVDPKKLRPGPIRNPSLPAELLQQIQAVFEVIGPWLNMTLEEFEIGFMRDMHPESEVAVWSGITAAWLAYHEKFLGHDVLPDDEERRLLGCANCDFHWRRRRVETKRARGGWTQVGSLLRGPGWESVMHLSVEVTRFAEGNMPSKRGLRNPVRFAAT
jgi:hypothetical protein